MTRTTPLTIAGWCVLGLVALAVLRMFPALLMLDRTTVQFLAEALLGLSGVPAAVALVVDGGTGRWRPRFVGWVTAAVLAVIAVATFLASWTMSLGEYGDEPLSALLLRSGGSLVMASCVAVPTLLARNRRRAVVAGASRGQARGLLAGAGVGLLAGALFGAVLLVTRWGGSPVAGNGAVGGAVLGTLLGVGLGWALERPSVPGRRPAVLLVVWWVLLVLTALIGLVVAALPVGLQFFGERADKVDHQESAIAAAAAIVPVVAAGVGALALRSRIAVGASILVVAGFVLLAGHYLAGVATAPANRFDETAGFGVAGLALLNPLALAQYVGFVLAVVQFIRARRACSTSPRPHP